MIITYLAFCVLRDTDSWCQGESDERIHRPEEDKRGNDESFQHQAANRGQNDEYIHRQSMQ